MTRFPIIKDAVAQYFGEDPIDSINPDEVVAVGAAIQASQLTRVSEDPLPPPDSIYGTFANGLRYDAVPVGYDHEAWLALFGSSWPAGSDAHVSYHDRLLHGPCGYTPFQAVRPGVRLTSSDQTFYFNFAFDLW